MSDNQTKPLVELNKCADCKKLFSKGEEYWSLNYQGKPVMSSCLTCWSKYSTEKKTWGS